MITLHAVLIDLD